MINRRELRDHFDVKKKISAIDFKQAKNVKNKPVFVRYKSKRIHSTGLLEVGSGYTMMLEWRDGSIRERRSFSAWLFTGHPSNITPLARLDYHGSHKPVHLHLNCEDARDLTNRALPGAKELNVSGKSQLDPALERDREHLINTALRVFNCEFDVGTDDLFS